MARVLGVERSASGSYPTGRSTRFTTGRPTWPSQSAAQFASSAALSTWLFRRQSQSKHVLLLDSEFDHWPADAPALLKVATFHDQFGGRRVLARTVGVLITPTGTLYSP